MEVILREMPGRSMCEFAKIGEFHLPEKHSFSFQLLDLSTEVKLSLMLVARCNLSEVGEAHSNCVPKLQCID